jgi:hypothetical protein
MDFEWRTRCLVLNTWIARGFWLDVSERGLHVTNLAASGPSAYRAAAAYGR